MKVLDPKDGDGGGSLNIRVSTNGTSGAMSIEHWQRRVAEIFLPFELQVTSEEEYRGSLFSETVGALQVSRITSSSATVLRPARLIAPSDPKLYKLDLQLKDQRTVSQDGRMATLEPGDFALYDMTRPYFLTFSTAELQSAAVLTFPRTLLPISYDAVSQITAMRVSGKDGIGALLSPLLAQLADSLDKTTYKVSDGIRLSSAILDLIAASLAEQLQFKSSASASRSNRSLILRVQSFIEEHLDDPDLSPRMTAEAHKISVRYLHKLFAKEGLKVAAWIRERRPERCRRDLADPTQLHRTISSIAARWGIANPAHFSYAFRNAFGISPREYRHLQSKPLNTDRDDVFSHV